MAQMKKWEFKGDVLSFGKVVCRNWKSRTIAVSERKAYSNLCHQYKMNNNLSAGANLKLDGELKEIFI